MEKAGLEQGGVITQGAIALEEIETPENIPQVTEGKFETVGQGGLEIKKGGGTPTEEELAKLPQPQKTDRHRHGS